MLVDAHNHLDFWEDEVSLIRTVEEYEVYTLCMSMDYSSYLRCLRMADSSFLFKCFGIHPWRVKGSIDVSMYEEEVSVSKVVGEVGLDFHWAKDRSKYSYQVQVFRDLCLLANKFDKMVNVHTKGAEAEVYEILKETMTPAIIHWYDGGVDDFNRLKELDTLFTISVDAGYNDLTDYIIKNTPLDRLLTETDGEGSMEWVDTTKKSSPLRVVEIGKYIANIKGMDYCEVRDRINKNFMSKII